ncbi:MAG: FAD-dependent oxidoreductase, partial [Chloroflexi bacterium]|nr:FAD-dependent oxidoreductase [Chloroflexota bacterium]
MTRYVLTAAAVAAVAVLVTIALVLGLSLATFQPPRRLVIFITMALVAALVYIALFEPQEVGGAAPNIMAGAAFGLLLWILAEILILPWLVGEPPAWRSADASSVYPLLFAYLLLGVFVSLGSKYAVAIVERRYGPLFAPVEEEVKTPIRSRIVILGGGFAGVEAARALEVEVENGIDITLLSDTNHLLFTPMLTEIVAGEVAGHHIGPALRTFFEDVRIVLGEPQSIDFQKQHIAIKVGGEIEQILNYAHLVVTVGAVPR